MFCALPVLFGQATEGQPPSYQVALLVTALLFVALILPFLLGHWLAKMLRMPDYWVRIGVILFSITTSAVIIAPKPKYLGGGWPPKLGIDLNGGAILVYKVDLKGEVGQNTSTAENGNADNKNRSDIKIEDVIAALSPRLNPDGLKEIVIRPFGQDHVEIVVPEVDPLEIDQIKKLIATAGILEFLVVAIPEDHESLISQAKAQAENPLIARNRFVEDESGKQIGYWAGVARNDLKEHGDRRFKVDVSTRVLRNGITGEILQIPDSVKQGSRREAKLEEYLEKQGINEVQVLMGVGDKDKAVTGADLGNVGSSFDTNNLRPKVDFSTNSSAASKRMGYLTQENLSTNSTERYLGIVLDGNLISAPAIRGVITDNGQITGDFSEAEINFLVKILRSGRLPAALSKLPESENRIDPLLGRDTIIKGAWSIAISLAAVLLFMLVYYRFSGVVACFVLIINIVLVVALMVLFKAPFTLPGLAGMVLTVGMSVDANVLIYERMREELAKGAALRMTIRNGFDRAFTTILDSNLTTLITAIILYVIGTDQVRGFAVTLTLGIAISMFTAVYCARVIFDIAERRRWITDLKMMQFVSTTNFDFMAIWKPASAISVVLILIGLAATWVRGREMLDIDFLGGTSAVPVLNQKMETDLVREQLTKKLGEKNIQFTLTSIHVSGEKADSYANRVYKIDTSIATVDELRKTLRESLVTSDGKTLLENYSMTFDTPKMIEEAVKKTEAAAEPAKTEDSKPKSDAAVSPPMTTEKGAAEKPTAEEKPSAPAKTETKPVDEKKADEKKGEEKKQEEKKAEEKPSEDKKPADEKKPAEKTSESPKAEEKKPEEKKADDKKSDEKPAEAKPESSPTEKKSSLRLRGFDNLIAFADDAAKAAAATEGTKTASDATDSKPAPAAETKATTSSDAAATTPPADASATEQPAKPKIADVYSESQLKFAHAINQATLLDRIAEAAKKLNLPVSEPALSNPDWDGVAGRAMSEWTLRARLAPEDLQKVLALLQEDLTSTPVFLTSSEIGGQVAGDTKLRAIYALLASLLGIVLYIWLRFHHMVWGVAAVIALIHDVLMMLAAIAISKWLAPSLGFLMIEEFKINLVIVAAFLTLVGYSINDTIVTFDRLREVRGKSPNLTKEMINLSINQTLSRTILTALTVFLVVVILYVLGGPSIHGFAFSMLVGVIVGCYSSIFIAAPVVLWMAESPAQATKTDSDKKSPVS